MMSGVELNALMNQVAETGTLPPGYQAGSKPYNRELWRINNGILEKSLVTFVLERTRLKKTHALAAGTARKANITLFKEDWIELVARLQNLLDDIVRDSPTLSWAKNIKLNHQLCSQKYRNLKKVYILSKQSDRKKFAYKDAFKEIEELDRIHRVCDFPQATLNGLGIVNLPSSSANSVDLNMSSSSIENSISIETSNLGENSENLEVKNEPEDLADHEIEEIHFDESDSPNSFNEQRQSPMYIEDTCKMEPESVSTAVQNQAFLELAQRQELLGRINQSLKSTLPQVVNQSEQMIPGPSGSNLNGTQPVQILPKPVKPVIPSVSLSPSPQFTSVTPSTPFEVALEKVSKSIEGWSNEAREYHAKMNKLMSDRNQILEEANQIHRERLTLERLKLDLMKRKDANQTK